MNLLRIEGVNHAHCIDDTENLPTRRGGSLMLLHAMPYIHEQFADTLKPVSTGASVGLFEVTDPARVPDIANEVRRLLALHTTFRHATFMVDQVSDDGLFSTCEYRAVNANRWKQMGSLSFSVTGMGQSEQAPHGACAFNTVRPARHTHTIQGETRHISTSVRDRRRVGVEQKQAFYDHELGELGALRRSRPGDDYTHEFAELSGWPRHPLDGKLAVFYADGNDFGRHAREANNPAALQEWDRAIKHYRRHFLDTLITHAQGLQGSPWQAKDDNSNLLLRIETLLWGGDEFMIAVPAWCGFELASMFLAASETMDYPPGSGSRLTHACGLVLCSHKTPISHIAALAKRLADQGKQDGKAHDSLNWLVLESLDHAGDSLGQYLKQRFPERADMTWKALALDRQSLDTLREQLPRLKDELPRGAITRAARMLAAGESVEHALLKASYQQVDAAMRDEHKKLWGDLWKAMHPGKEDWSLTPRPADLPAWIKLLETWDYVVEGGQA